jgi:hypothetical protein
MQTAIQVICTSGPSLRALIADQARSSDAWLVSEKSVGRNPGWMMVKSTERGIWGALNISWDTQTRTLTCRVVNKRYGPPHGIIGRFVAFLLEHDRKRKRKRIKLISIFEV